MIIFSHLKTDVLIIGEGWQEKNNKFSENGELIDNPSTGDL